MRHEASSIRHHKIHSILTVSVVGDGGPAKLGLKPCRREVSSTSAIISTTCTWWEVNTKRSRPDGRPEESHKLTCSARGYKSTIRLQDEGRNTVQNVR